MRKLTILLTIVSLLATLFGLPHASIATAQSVPANDDFDSATPVPGLPFSHAIDTSAATTAPDDPDCYGQGPTVWYVFTPTADVSLAANTFGSDYDTTLSVYTGTRGALTQVACNDDTGSLQSQVTLDVFAGVTYFFMVGAFASEPGGGLVFSVDVAPPPPPPLLVTLTLDPVGSVVPSKGTGTLRGTVTCSRPAYFDLFGSLQQKAGRAVIRGYFGTYIDCQGEASWTATVTSENGRFVGGKAPASVFAYAYSDTGDFATAEDAKTVQLRGSRPGKEGDESGSIFIPFVSR